MKIRLLPVFATLTLACILGRASAQSVGDNGSPGLRNFDNNGTIELVVGTAGQPLALPVPPPTASPAVQGCAGGSCQDSCFRPTCDSGGALSAEINYLLMWRDHPSTQALFSNADGTTTILNARQFNFVPADGMELNLCDDLGDGLKLEARYMGIYDARAGASFAYTGGVGGNLLLTSVNTTLSGSGTSFNQYLSELNSAEFNVEHRLFNDLYVLAGFRWINLSEELQNEIFATGSTTPSAFADWHTQNNLYGFQVGLDATLWRARAFQLDAFVRLGIYEDEARMEYSIANAHEPIGYTSQGSNNIAFAGEFGVTGRYFITNNLSVNVGYDFLALAGVALASPQLSTSASFSSTALLNSSNVNNNGSTYFQGLRLGLEFRY